MRHNFTIKVFSGRERSRSGNGTRASRRECVLNGKIHIESRRSVSLLPFSRHIASHSHPSLSLSPLQLAPGCTPSCNRSGSTGGAATFAVCKPTRKLTSAPLSRGTESTSWLPRQLKAPLTANTARRVCDMQRKREKGGGGRGETHRERSRMLCLSRECSWL